MLFPYLFRRRYPVTGLQVTIPSSLQLVIHPYEIRRKLGFRFLLPDT
jgi:hypothetical protein